MKNIYNVDLKPVKWQKTEKLADKDVCIIAPTGAGKTIAAYNWAFSDSNANKVIFTAPIKALSNERYFELKNIFGAKNVGILTGDVKINSNAKYLCMTQEIYTNRYAPIANQRVIIDEVHYMFQDMLRSRAYLDGILQTNENSKLMFLSATINKSTVEYLEKISNRNLHLISIKRRPVEIEYLKNNIGFKGIINNSPALVFVFSARGVVDIAERLANKLSGRKKFHTEQINKYAEKFKIKNAKLLDTVTNGVGMYHGGMLYKEKVFVERLFRQKFIDIVVGTDSLALGVNLPAQIVAFGQLAKYYDGPITKKEFLQMAGRAGRPNLFDRGYVGWFDSGFESHFHSTGDLYSKLLKAQIEPEQLLLTPDYRKIFEQISFKELNNIESKKINKIIDEEVEYIKAYSILPKKTRNYVGYINRLPMEIRFTIDFVAKHIMSEYAYEIFKSIYFSEFATETNLYAANKIAEEGHLDAINFYYDNAEKDDQREMLQFMRFYNGINKNKFKIINLKEFIKTINDIDEFVLNPDELQNQIEEVTSELN